MPLYTGEKFPAEFRELLAKCMAQNPADRPSMEEVSWNDLHHLLLSRIRSVTAHQLFLFVMLGQASKHTSWPPERAEYPARTHTLAQVSASLKKMLKDDVMATVQEASAGCSCVIS